MSIRGVGQHGSGAPSPGPWYGGGTQGGGSAQGSAGAQGSSGAKGGGGASGPKSARFEPINYRHIELPEKYVKV